MKAGRPASLRETRTIRVLLADDDLDFLDVTAYALRRAGYAVTTASNGHEALESWRAHQPDIVLLDVSMPLMSGTDVCKAIRDTSDTPVILISNARRESDIVHGLEAGADDYVAKPFSIPQLVMRLQAIHRRTSGQPRSVTPKRLVAGPMVIDLDSFTLTLDDKPVQLTRLEFRLLYCLSANLGRVVATSRLIDFAWGLDGDSDGSLLKTHISHIRRKLQEASDQPISIRAVPGVGYTLEISTANTVLSKTSP
jgi:DNA-binding response OmpR family regulator